jgi:hypothetical protein
VALICPPIVVTTPIQPKSLCRANETRCCNTAGTSPRKWEGCGRLSDCPTHQRALGKCQLIRLSMTTKYTTESLHEPEDSSKTRNILSASVSLWSRLKQPEPAFHWHNPGPPSIRPSRISPPPILTRPARQRTIPDRQSGRRSLRFSVSDPTCPL